MKQFGTFIEEPKTLLEVKVNLERAINALRSYYTIKFTDTIHTEGVEKSEVYYKNMHAMEAMHNIKLTIEDS